MSCEKATTRPSVACLSSTNKCLMLITHISKYA
jgi:hypothetical protein